MVLNISIKELLNKNNINIIDIRSIEKYNDNHINGAINIPYILLLKDPEKYLNKIEEYYIYCQYGKNSLKVCNILAAKGYKVYNVIKGYEGWLLER